eukprot:3841553-Rhodomonas_salina.1
MPSQVFHQARALSPLFRHKVWRWARAAKAMLPVSVGRDVNCSTCSGCEPLSTTPPSTEQAETRFPDSTQSLAARSK